MAEIRISEQFWSTSLAPEGVLEGWRSRDGGLVRDGASVARVRIEDAIHEILAPCSGRLSILLNRNAVVEPGTVIGQIRPE